MRRPRREVAGGEMALMAVMTKAMGAFLVIMIMLLPYYTGDTAAQQTINQTNEQLRKAGDDLSQVKQLLGKGRLSDEEIDELVKKIDDAQKALDEARALVATLQVKLDQAQSQITRLEAENKALTAQVEDLMRRLAEAQAEVATARALAVEMKRQLDEANANVARLKTENDRLADENKKLADDVEELKKHQGVASQVMFTASWTGCSNADFQFYVQTNLPGQDGRLGPPGSFRYQRPVPADAHVYSFHATTLTGDSGATWWKSEVRKGEQTFTVWLKRLNLLPFNAQACTVRLFIVGGSEQKRADFVLPAVQKIFMGRYRASKDGKNIEAEKQPPASEIEPENFSCDALLCMDLKNPPSTEKLAEWFKDYVQAGGFFSERLLTGLEDDAALEIGKLVAAQTVSLKIAYGWLELFYSNIEPEASPAQSAERVAKLRPLLAQKGVPPIASHILLSISAKVDFDILMARVANLPDAPSAELLEDSKKYVARGASKVFALALARARANKELSDVALDEWIAFEAPFAARDDEIGKDAPQPESAGAATKAAPGNVIFGALVNRTKPAQETSGEASKISEQGASNGERIAFLGKLQNAKTPQAMADVLFRGVRGGAYSVDDLLDVASAIDFLEGHAPNTPARQFFTKFVAQGANRAVAGDLAKLTASGAVSEKVASEWIDFLQPDPGRAIVNGQRAKSELLAFSRIGKSRVSAPSIARALAKVIATTQREPFEIRMFSERMMKATGQ